MEMIIDWKTMFSVHSKDDNIFMDDNTTKLSLPTNIKNGGNSSAKKRLMSIQEISSRIYKK